MNAGATVCESGKHVLLLESAEQSADVHSADAPLNVSSQPIW